MDDDGKEIGSKVLSRKKRFLIFPTGRMTLLLQICHINLFHSKGRL